MAIASEDRAVEKETSRREYRTKLECKSRRDLQALAKEFCIPANLKSNEIIDGILRAEYVDVPFQTRTSQARNYGNSAFVVKKNH